MGLKRLKHRVKTFFLNRRLTQYKYVHLMFNDKFTAPMVEFFNKTFNPSEHIFLVKHFYQEFPMPRGENVVVVKSYKGCSFKKNQKVFCHSLFDYEVVKYLYAHPDILKEKAYWVIWGGDLYNAPRDEVNDFVRSNFKGYSPDVDQEVAMKNYHLEGKPFYSAVVCAFPTKGEMTEHVTPTSHDGVRVQINNSCDRSTLEILDQLARFKDEKLRVYTILSYGQMDYKEAILEKGRELFGEKFEPIEEYLAPEAYTQHMADIDILILNQNRQQGLGNVRLCLQMGKKVFIREDVTPYTWLRNAGLPVANTCALASMAFEDFCAYPERATAIETARDFYDIKKQIVAWQEVLDA